MPPSAKTLAVTTGLAALLAASPAAAMAVWPASWNELTAAGGPYWDDPGDENPASTDLVGGSDGVGSFTAGYWSVSTDDDQISLRMRLDASGSSSNNVWQFLLETDGDPSTVDWGLVVRQSGNPSLRQVYFNQATTGGNTFDDVELSSTASWTGALADWRRWGATGDSAWASWSWPPAQGASATSPRTRGSDPKGHRSPQGRPLMAGKPYRAPGILMVVANPVGVDFRTCWCSSPLWDAWSVRRRLALSSRRPSGPISRATPADPLRAHPPRSSRSKS